MIQCANCKTLSAPDGKRCRQCNADLLPGMPTGQRLLIALAGPGAMVFFWTLLGLASPLLHAPLDQSNPLSALQPAASVGLFLAALGSTVGAVALLWVAFAPTPLDA